MIPILLAILVGSAVPTIVVDGTTLPASAVVSIKDKAYVSLRAAASALSADVAFDGRTKTVTLTTVVRQAVMRIGDTTVMASDGRCLGHPDFKGFSLSLTAKDEAEAERLFAALGTGGEVQMPLARTFFSPRFGMVADRFGVSWKRAAKAASAVAVEAL